MATLLLTAVGTAIGGPIGGAIGAFAGKQVDRAVFGAPSREGPRLQGLKITTSSYGQPIARHFGQMRAAGTVIWSTDLVERRETSGGGKGKPETTSYTYSVSFAVALASQPIDRLGRIWADGTLLRGAAGDLKVGGTLRFHDGWGDQTPDPLIFSAEGADCPAFRNIAYVVFEDLQLADFGNRIPALSFEVFNGEASTVIVEMLGLVGQNADADVAPLSGYSWSGGNLASILSDLGELHPLFADTGSGILSVRDTVAASSGVTPLPDPASGWGEDDFGEQVGHRRIRESNREIAPNLLRYYDVTRDYQPGVQRADGRPTNGRIEAVEFPAALNAGAARSLITQAAQRHLFQRDQLSWRTTELNSGLAPGKLVLPPGIGGVWRIVGWEWRERGVELELLRASVSNGSQTESDPGRGWTAPDLPLTPTELRAFELPIADMPAPDRPALYAAASSSTAAWPGAALFAEQNDTLVPLDISVRRRALGGALVSNLAASSTLRFEADASMDILLLDDAFDLASTDMAGIALGTNRALVGSELLQFATAEKTGSGGWRLSGLLRGRGGTEHAAMAGHESGAQVTIIDGSLLAIETGSERIAAIGHADTSPAYATVENRGLSLRPLAPVHAQVSKLSDGGLCITWCRRARGAWQWRDEVDAPLVEDREAYHVGLGTVSEPELIWEVSSPRLEISPSERATLLASHAGKSLWVRQIGTHAQSHRVALGILT